MFKVISFDLFLTLADLDARVPILWERIFEKPLTSEEINAHADALRACYMPHYHDLYQPPFQTMEKVFYDAFVCYFGEIGCDADPVRATKIFLEEHNRCPIYPDARRILERLQGKYRVILSTDADLSMVGELLPQIPHEMAFVSEAMGVYKSNAESAFFREVLEKTGVQPEEILHVGDGRPDIIGARRSGIPVFHIDRKGKGLPADFGYSPDYRGASLDELSELLGV
ncbi:MAG: HAD family hydrolase [Ruminococcaceae bacterium]|nr:HAD family hydrolase [Oscillospiraceae bacterium]